jgi:hypothetical protein
VVIDGGYSKKRFLRLPRRATGWWSAGCARTPPGGACPRRPRRAGRKPVYGKRRISLAKLAGQKRGGQQVECLRYGQKVTKMIKAFLATWKPAGGLIRVVLDDRFINS